MNRDRENLQYILVAIGRIEAYALVGRVAFLTESLAQDGIIRQLEIIGEAVKRLSSELRAQNPVVPWSAFAGMRDVLIHRFERVDLTEVWHTVAADVPPLKSNITAILATVPPVQE